MMNDDAKQKKVEDHDEKKRGLRMTGSLTVTSETW